MPRSPHAAHGAHGQGPQERRRAKAAGSHSGSPGCLAVVPVPCPNNSNLGSGKVPFRLRCQGRANVSHLLFCRKKLLFVQQLSLPVYSSQTWLLISFIPVRRLGRTELPLETRRPARHAGSHNLDVTQRISHPIICAFAPLHDCAYLSAHQHGQEGSPEDKLWSVLFFLFPDCLWPCSNPAPGGGMARGRCASTDRGVFSLG